MRSAGFTLFALLIGVTAAAAQPPGSPGVPAVPGVPPPLPPGAAPADKKLDSYLDSWERTMTGLTNFRFELALIRKVDPAATGVFKTDKEYVGVILCMKPNFAILRLDYVPDLNNKEKKKKDYEAFICDGKAVYVYSGLDETITKHKLPDPKTNPAGATDNFILDIMTGMKAKDVKQRFDIKLFNEDQYYIYLDIKPLQDRDKQEFKQLKLALYGPSTEFAYLPAQVLMVKPDNSTEQWKLTKPQTNIKGIGDKDFQYKDVPGYRPLEAPQQPGPVRPGMPTTPQLRPGVPSPIPGKP